MQIKLIILIICVSLVTIGFAAPPPQANKPADKANDVPGSILGGSTFREIPPGGIISRRAGVPVVGGVLQAFPAIGPLLNNLLGSLGGKSGKGQLGSLLGGKSGKGN
ncbi:hypothetical protein RMATCC62417_06661 [Rhizopus microsporus]|nr:hypothetical protein RMATCC62417_06661 [Rhizopus microsporus]